MPDRDQLDRLIDSELARYAEPRVGLEQRILARVDAESSTPSSPSHTWRLRVLGGAIAIALVLSIALPQLTSRKTSTTTAHVAIPEHAPAARAQARAPESKIQFRALPKVAPRTPQVVRVSKSNRISERTTHPRLDIFPAPQPLSPQEQALVVIATAPSASARENLIESQRQSGALLQISALDIPPITTPDEGRK